ncbi:MAG: AIR synthase-related protein, partial [Planctomycetes bacterium]|nr:AIR synthase-related protein [Planctomycetota bacterium]
MVHRIEIAPKPGLRDPRGDAARDAIRGFLGIPVAEVRTRDVYKVDAPLSPGEVEAVRAEFTDPVIQESSAGRHPPEPFDWLVLVGFLPGVTDSVGRSARVAVEDVTGRAFGPGAAAYTEREYFLRGPSLTRRDAERIGADLLANPLIERIRVFSREEWEGGTPDLEVPSAGARAETRVAEIDLEGGDAELLRISREGTLALTLEEMRAIRDYYRRPGVVQDRGRHGLRGRPTDAELECLAQTWSEHCKHKIFNADIEVEEPGRPPETIRSLFATCIRAPAEEIAKEKDWLVSLFRDNAGVVRFNERWNLAYKVETHNSPSALDPYGGAMTGIVGVNRDPFGTGLGAKLLVNVWGYCFADPFRSGPLPEGLLHPRRVRDGVHKGVIDGGNQSGIPYGLGWEWFDDRYLGKPLVYCGTVGIMPAEVGGFPSHEKRVRPGDRIVMVGGRIGKDGIHGATFSSEALHGSSPAQAVQIGNPIVQKMMTDFLLEARDAGLYSGITDNGAGGLSSSVGEMARQPGGAEIDLSRAPLKYEGLQPWEVLLSEAQERMTVAVPPDRLEAFLELARRREVEATDLGRFTDSGFFHASWGGRTVARLDMEFLHEGVPTLRLRARWDPPRFPEPPRDGVDLAQALRGVLSSLNVCSIEKKSRQYDHEVKGRTVVKPFVGVRRDVPSDATVFLAELGGGEGIVLSRGVNPALSDLDAYAMSAAVVDEAFRRVVAVGGRTDRVAGLDNFCWPDPVESPSNPDGRHKLAQLVRANRALRDVTLAYGVPCISGKDSMKNDSTRGGVRISVPPTLLFSALGKIDDARRAVTLDAKEPGDFVYVLGRTGPELGASEYFRWLARERTTPGAVGSGAPGLDPASALALYRAVERAIREGRLRSCHATTLGGLGVALAWTAFGGDLGIEADLGAAPGAEALRPDEALFAESNARFVATAAPGDAARLEVLLRGLPFARVGTVTAERRLALSWRGKPAVNADLE